MKLMEPPTNQVNKHLRSNPPNKENLSLLKLHGITHDVLICIHNLKDPAPSLSSFQSDVQLCNQYGITKQVSIRLVKVTKDSSEMQSESQVQSKGLKMLACTKPNCTFKGRLPWILKNHLKSHVESRNYICKLCNRTYKLKGDLQAHLKVTHNLHMQMCDTSEEIVCYSRGCRYRFRSPTSYKEHQRLHPKDLPYKCRFCKEVFKQKFQLVRHERTSHRKIRFSCPLCSFRSDTNAHIRSHIGTHTGEKPYKCHLCEYSGRRLAHLKDHLKYHGEEKDYKCNLCHKRFFFRCHLESHLRTHTREKPFKCEMCNKRFAVHVQLVIHTRTHTGEKPYACTLCPYTASQSGGLKIHMRRNHSYPVERKRDFKCSLCSKTFFDNYVLSLHTRTHSEQKPYSCQFCVYASKRKNDLNHHVQRMHRKGAKSLNSH